jgi:hypothetical protein
MASFEKKPAKPGNAGDGQRRDQHGAEGRLDLAVQRAHVLHLLLAAHGVNHRAGSEEEQRLEERVGEDVEDARGKCSDAERQEHVAELRDRRVRQHALDVVLHQGDRRRENRGQRADDGDRLHRIGRQHEQRAFDRATMYTPAVTMVAAWISAETGVGPSIASGSQT